MEFIVANAAQLGPILQGWRTELGLTQQEVGDLVGLRQSAISSFEKNPSRASIERMFRILSALQLELTLREKRSTQPQQADGLEW